MKLLSASAFPRHQIGLFEYHQVFCDGLASHLQPLAKISQRLAIFLVQPVEELPTARVRQCLENCIIVNLDIGNHLVPYP